MATLKELIRGNELIVAPVVCNPIMALLAQEAGFKAIYLSGGTLGWVKNVTEANLTLPEMAEVAVDIRASCKLPLVLDAGGGCTCRYDGVQRYGYDMKSALNK